MTKTRFLVQALVVAAVAGVLWLKRDHGSSAVTYKANPDAHTRVMLFADPREANSSCGCAEVIRIARHASDIPDVAFQEFDPRTNQSAAQEHGVRVFPTVLIMAADGGERGRFEGEAPAVINDLRTAIASLEGASPPLQP